MFTANKVSAKEILKGKHVAIYFANTDMEKQQEREKQLKQRKQEGMPNYVRSISIVKQVRGYVCLVSLVVAVALVHVLHFFG